MRTPLFPIAAVWLASVAFLHAEEAAKTEPSVAEAASTEPAGAGPSKTAALPPYELKKRSAFATSGEIARAPFWPIGWVKRKAGAPVQSAAEVVEQKVVLDEKSFKVTSILLGSGTSPSLAVINGRAYSEGEFLRMPKGGTTPAVRVRVQRINDGHVILQNAAQTLVTTLQRPELSTKRPEEALLDPDR